MNFFFTFELSQGRICAKKNLLIYYINNTSIRVIYTSRFLVEENNIAIKVLDKLKITLLDHKK